MMGWEFQTLEIGLDLVREKVTVTVHILMFEPAWALDLVRCWTANLDETGTFSAMTTSFIISFLFNAILTFRTTRQAGTEYGCQAGWHYEPANEYCYLFTRELWTTWINARANCLGLGADLTSIHSEEENDLIFDLISGYAWIGITDVENEGVFTTFTDGSPIDYQNWAVENYQNNNRDCAFMKHDDNKVWFWQTCSVTEIRSVCKKSHELITTSIPATLVPVTTAGVLPSIWILCATPVFEIKEAWCALLMESVGEHSNYTFCFEDSEDSCSVAKPESWSLDDIPDALKESAASMNGYLASFHNYIYTVVGSFEVTAVINQTLAAEVNLTVNHSCIRSLSILVKRHCDIPDPDVYLRALDIDVSAIVELDEHCIDPMTSDFKWWIYTSTEHSNISTAFEKITHIPHVTILWGTIAYGNYSLKLKAETHRKLSDELVGEEEITTWLEIQPSPLVAVISGGTSRSHWLLSNLIVDGRTSYDPDVIQGSPSDLTFSWYCVLVHSDIMYASLEEAMQNADEACFEEGIMMDSASPKLEVPSSNLRANVLMNFWLLVSKEGRISGSTQQRIHLTPGLWLQIEISCISNCNKYIITPERLVLQASCTNCESEHEDISFQWSLMSNHSSLIDDLSSQTTTGLDQPYLVIKPHTFDSLSETGDVILRVTGYAPDSGSFGYAEFEVKVAAPPPLGCCLVTPMEGYALQTDFAVSCYGFTGLNSPLTFELIQFNRVHQVDGNLVGLGEGLQFYEGLEPFRDGFSLPVGDGAHNHTVLLQVIVRDCYMAASSVFMSATVYPSTLGENITQELLNLKSSVDSRVNKLLTVGDTGQAAQLISALGSILNSIGDEDDVEEDDKGRETRKEIRSSLVDSVDAIPLESIAALKQSSAALAVITHNKQEISMELQMKAASVLAGLASFLKAESSSYSQDQKDIESAGTILVEGLSNILSAAKEMKRLLSTDTSQDREEYEYLTEVALSAISDIQDAIAHGKIPGEEATVITSPTLSIAVSSINRDNLPGATFEGSDDDSLGSFSMPYRGLDDIVDSVIGTTLTIQMTAFRWNPFSLEAGGESVNSSMVGIQLKADHSTLQVRDLSADISVYLPMKEPLSRESFSAHISKNYSAFLFVNHSSLPEDGAIHLKVIAENEPFAALSICTANISVNEKTNCSEVSAVESFRTEDLNTATNFTWTVSVADFRGADGIIIGLYDGIDQPVYENENISLSLFIYTSQCSFWNDDKNEWSNAGCKVGPLSNPTTTHCLCNRLTFFGSSLLVPPTRITIFKDSELFQPSCCESLSVHFNRMYLFLCYIVYFCCMLFL